MKLLALILAVTIFGATPSFSQCSETEDSFKEHILNNIQTLDQIEGIWTVTSSLRVYDKSKRLIDLQEGQNQVLRITIKRDGDNFMVCGLPRERDDKSIETFRKTATKGLYLYHHLDKDSKIDSKSTATLSVGGILEYSFEPFSEAKVRSILGRDYVPGMKVLIESNAIKVFPTEDDYIRNVPITASGTGFALTQGGLIVTNNHVIINSGTINVYGINGDFSIPYKATLVIADANNDLAIIKVSDPSFSSIRNIPYTIKTSLTNVGESVAVLGYPLRASMGDEIKLTTGIVSSRTGFKGDVTSYQISAAIQPGNSGGPLFDSQGNLIGIINAKHSDAENASYAIKVNYLMNLIELLPTVPSFNESSLLNGKTLPEQIQLLKNIVYIIEAKTDGAK